MATYTYNGKRSFAGEFFDSLAAFYRKRWLLRYFVRRQVTRSYKRSYLGLAWAILGPLIWVFFLTLIFSEVVGLRFREVEGDPTLNFGLFLYCGLLPFMAFSEALTKGLNSIRNNAGLVQKVVFPLELLPFTNAVASLVDKLFGVGALVFIVFVLQHRLHWQVLLLPLIIVLQLLFTLGLTYIMAVVGTYVPDMGEVLRPIIRGTFFITPILWPPETLPENLRFINDYNPLAYLVGAYRDYDPRGYAPWRAGDALLRPVLRGPVPRRLRAVRQGEARVCGPPVTPAISLRGIGKKYRISPSRSSRLGEILSFGKAKRSHEFWALQDINLDVEPGTTLGVVGRNGAGKSTLLEHNLGRSAADDGRGRGPRPAVGDLRHRDGVQPALYGTRERHAQRPDPWHRAR